MRALKQFGLFISKVLHKYEGVLFFSVKLSKWAGYLKQLFSSLTIPCKYKRIELAQCFLLFKIALWDMNRHGYPSTHIELSSWNFWRETALFTLNPSGSVRFAVKANLSSYSIKANEMRENILLIKIKEGMFSLSS